MTAKTVTPKAVPTASNRPAITTLQSELVDVSDALVGLVRTAQDLEPKPESLGAHTGLVGALPILQRAVQSIVERMDPLVAESAR